MKAAIKHKKKEMEKLWDEFVCTFSYVITVIQILQPL